MTQAFRGIRCYGVIPFFLRDIGGSDPERMAAPRVEEYVTQAFQGTQVTVDVVKGQATFEAEYPCLAAVNR